MPFLNTLKTDITKDNIVSVALTLKQKDLDAMKKLAKKRSDLTTAGESKLQNKSGKKVQESMEWKNVSSPVDGQIKAVAYGEGKFVAVGEEGTILICDE